MSRPFMGNSIIELERIVADAGEDERVLGAVLEELGHRQTHRANRLRGRVQVRLTGRGGSSSSTAPPALVESPPVPVRARQQWPNDLASRYQALRATFTEEAEVLARWGMTPVLPADLRDRLLEEWHRRLQSAEAHPLGLGREDLESDLARLAGLGINVSSASIPGGGKEQ